MVQRPDFPLPIMTGNDMYVAFVLLLPVIVVALTALLVLVADLIPPDWASRRPLMWVSVLGLVIAAAVDVYLATSGTSPSGWLGYTAFAGFLVFDGFAVFFQLIFILAAALVILAAN